MMTSCRKCGSEKYSGGGGKELEKCCWKLKKLRLKLKIRVRQGLRKWNFKLFLERRCGVIRKAQDNRPKMPDPHSLEERSISIY